MVCCFAPGCNHKSSDGRCSFFRFPTDVVQWRLWVRAIRRADRKPSTHSRVCSCHFPSGDRKVPVLFVATNVVPIGQNSEDHSYCLSGSKTSLSSSIQPAAPGSRPRLRDRLRARARFSGMSWLLSPEQEDKIKEEPYTLATLSVPRIVESVGHQGPEAILASMALSEKQQRVIQVETTGQRTNPNWHLFRRGRLTASNFGAVLKSKRVTAPLLARVLGQQQALDSVLSVQWGTVNESQGIRAFTTATQMPVQESGWWLSPSGLLGASPDGLVGSSAVLEVKCPYGAREMTITEALQIKGFCVSKEGGSYSLREDHPYWHQVQGQLHLTARQTCYFVVWTTKDSVIIPVARDDNWQSNLLALEDFFKAHMLPKLTLQ